MSASNREEWPEGHCAYVSNDRMGSGLSNIESENTCKSSFINALINVFDYFFFCY